LNQEALVLLDEAARRELENLLAIKRLIESEIETL
jgi:hypothetical protein